MSEIEKHYCKMLNLNLRDLLRFMRMKNAKCSNCKVNTNL